MAHFLQALEVTSGGIQMVWGKRRLAGIDYARAMDLIEKLMMANATLYREFIMVSVKAAKFGTSDYYVRPFRTRAGFRRAASTFHSFRIVFIIYSTFKVDLSSLVG